jgi:asparagine synthase (glutamine-hydrolysing)
MCGINLVRLFDHHRVTLDSITRMNRALSHRGPDASDSVIVDQVALGHTRLSIVDIQGGKQPMQSQDGNITLVFNGEIYNFRQLRKELKKKGLTFRTHSDTEVVLKLYETEGTDCLKRLRGMFCFAIHDTEKQLTFLARDRLGIKPLFYYRDKKQLVASSEIKALYASGLVTPAFNPDSIFNYFTYQFSVSPHTPFDSVQELPPGHLAIVRHDGKFSIRQYWDLEFPLDGDYESLDEEYWTRRFSDALNDAVDSHAIGDVPIGAYLSGGIDSSTLTWLLNKQQTTTLETFSIHFTNPAMDESGVYSKTARHLGVANRELTMDDQRPEGFVDDLLQCLYHLEQPQRLAVDIPHYMLSGLVQNSQYKVVYTGDGADEIFGGYDCYRQDYMRYWGTQIRNTRQRRRHYLSEFTQYFAEDYIRMIYALHKPKNQRRVVRRFGCYPAWHDFWHIMHGFFPKLFEPDFLRQVATNAQMDELAENMKPQLAGRHMLNQSLYIEAKTRLPGWILWKSDRLSMAHSVEARVPFMDHPLVELAASMPPILKLNGMDEKYLLKKIARPHLPDHPADHKKRAFYTPIKDWFFTPERYPMLESYLSRKALRDCGIFRPDYVSHLYQRLGHFRSTGTLNDYYRTMQLEWVLFLVLTVQMLHHNFVRRQAPCFDES